MVDGQAVRWSQLQHLMAERSGGLILAEVILDRQVQKALTQRGMTITEEDTDREKRLMRQTLADDPDEGARLLAELRADRGLGSQRFALWLRINAGLRKLIANEVIVPETAVREAYQQQYGPQTEVRIIVVQSLREAQDVLEGLAAGQSFIDLALAHSVDSSRTIGGLLPPISPSDRSMSKDLRDTAVALDVGQISEPIALKSGYAILRCERKISGRSLRYEDVADQLRRQVRRRLERMLMERRTRAMLEAADVTVFDPELKNRWQRRRDEVVKP